ncbi:hypothetical protein D1007_48133 [Hordeum vulgare]|nr:hypothetical protein D1007_48133 [Hordeum vulgare]
MVGSATQVEELYFGKRTSLSSYGQLKEIIPSETHIGRRRADIRHPVLDSGVDVGGSWDRWKERRGLTAVANCGDLGSNLMGPSVEREGGVDDMPPPVPAVVVPLLETPDWMGG